MSARAELVLTLILFSPACISFSTASGRLPLVLILILPLFVCFLISIIDSRIVSHISNGSPSQPCPKLTIGYGAVSRWGTVYSTISAAVGLKLRRSCVETIVSSSGWKEIQPMQFALQAGEEGMGHSQRPMK